jgi:hypothetical protein
MRFAVFELPTMLDPSGTRSALVVGRTNVEIAGIGRILEHGVWACRVFRGTSTAPSTSLNVWSALRDIEGYAAEIEGWIEANDNCPSANCFPEWSIDKFRPWLDANLFWTALFHLGSLSRAPHISYWIVTGTITDFPPPGLGLSTLMSAVPGTAISDAGISATNFKALSHFVVRLDPFHCTTVPRTKWEPLIVSKKLTPFEVSGEGLTDATAGRGFGPSAG